MEAKMPTKEFPTVAGHDKYIQEAKIIPAKGQTVIGTGMAIGFPLDTSGKSFLVDHGGPECPGSNTQHHGPACITGPLLDHLDPAWTTSCNHTLENCRPRWIKVDQRDQGDHGAGC